MSIRRLLSWAFFALALSAGVLLASLSFYAAGLAMRAEIGRNLSLDAATLMEPIDVFLFERLHNLHSWQHLDVIQDARLADVDKRLARFLEKNQRSYAPLYRRLFFTAPEGRIIASSDSSSIGQPRALNPSTLLADQRTQLDTPQLSSDGATVVLNLHVPVASAYADADIGELHSEFDLAWVNRLFDQTEAQSLGQRHVVLLDADGRLLAASASVREQGHLLSPALADWAYSPTGNPFIRSGAPLTAQDVLVGYQTAGSGPLASGLQWSVWVFQPADQAFQPIMDLLGWFAAALASVGALAWLAAQWVARRIARPLLRLTAWARDYHPDDAAPNAPPVLSGTREISALSQAFARLIDSLHGSRQHVVRAAKLAVVGEMAAAMAHEVRTPLGILHTTAQLLQREPGLGEDGREMTRLLLEETARLERLVGTLLDCARPRPPQMTPLDVQLIVQRAVDLLSGQARKKRIQIHTANATETPLVGDRELLMQVFLNLLLNAIQILPEAGRIDITTHDLGDTWRIDIADDGPGIAPEHLNRLFDPFFTQREGGIGLGLTVTQQIVATHGGRITVTAASSGGACFQVSLPKKPSEGSV